MTYICASFAAHEQIFLPSVNLFKVK